MQNRATINLFLGTCMYVCAYIIPVYALVGPSMCSFMRTNETNTLRSAQQFVKMFHFEEFEGFDVFD